MRAYAKPANELWVIEDGDGKIRLIIFEKDEETGARSVFDILEVDLHEAPVYAELFYDSIDIRGDEYGIDDVKIHFDGNDGVPVDYGKAQKGGSKMLKIIEQLVRTLVMPPTEEVVPKAPSGTIHLKTYDADGLQRDSVMFDAGDWESALEFVKDAASAGYKVEVNQA